MKRYTLGSNMRTTIVERREDMSPVGFLRLICQPDGDVIVAVHGYDELEDCETDAEVEFCASGGRSPKTLRALRAFAEAMAAENDTARIDIGR